LTNRASKIWKRLKNPKQKLRCSRLESKFSLALSQEPLNQFGSYFQSKLSLYEVNLKWFRDFQKKKIYRLSGRIRTFYRKKPNFMKKKPSICRLSNNVVQGIIFLPFNLKFEFFGFVIFWCSAMFFAFSAILTNSFE
jgi:hypothetical protein